jgi:hypothetical protein
MTLEGLVPPLLLFLSVLAGTQRATLHSHVELSAFHSSKIIGRQCPLSDLPSLGLLQQRRLRLRTCKGRNILLPCALFWWLKRPTNGNGGDVKSAPLEQIDAG